jgi:antitoxin VapB
MVELICISSISSRASDIMRLNIKNDEAYKLATELAGLTGESLTSAVTLALQERLARERRRRRPDLAAARLMKIGSRYAAIRDVARMKSSVMTTPDCRHNRGR